jgi:hypothetical protein
MTGFTASGMDDLFMTVRFCVVLYGSADIFGTVFCESTHEIEVFMILTKSLVVFFLHNCCFISLG